MKKVTVCISLISLIYVLCQEEAPVASEPTSSRSTSLTAVQMVSSALRFGGTETVAAGPESASCAEPDLFSCGEGEVSVLGFSVCRRDGLSLDRYSLTLSILDGETLYCPTSWAAFYGKPGARLLRSYDYAGTTPAGNELHVSTSAVSGWDPQVRLSANPIRGHRGIASQVEYGIELRALSGSAVTMHIYGAQHRIHVPEARRGWLRNLVRRAHASTFPSRGAGPVLFDQTISSDDLTITMSGSKKTISSGFGYLVVQENRRKRTSRSKLSSVTWDHGPEGCGCLPVSGQVVTAFSGSRTGGETVTFDAKSCGSYTLQEVDVLGNPSGPLVRGVLATCL